ncbi:hypothetical protein D9619_013372 [Psilocybe cf. subviscida]|uniref:Uncharacterized protein n=1 Tax=Psilocybe cf. subviscida TaxID=2480587 RepID=A0A8H5BSI0_9AGAR|nr:hypothetical protein D9619_013372 [Psilocybe cf. subviscida]
MYSVTHETKKAWIPCPRPTNANRGNTRARIDQSEPLPSLPSESIGIGHDASIKNTRTKPSVSITGGLDRPQLFLSAQPRDEDGVGRVFNGRCEKHEQEGIAGGEGHRDACSDTSGPAAPVCATERCMIPFPMSSTSEKRSTAAAPAPVPALVPATTATGTWMIILGSTLFASSFFPLRQSRNDDSDCASQVLDGRCENELEEEQKKAFSSSAAATSGEVTRADSRLLSTSAPTSGTPSAPLLLASSTPLKDGKKVNAAACTGGKTTVVPGAGGGATCGGCRECGEGRARAPRRAMKDTIWVVPMPSTPSTPRRGEQAKIYLFHTWFTWAHGEVPLFIVLGSRVEEESNGLRGGYGDDDKGDDSWHGSA